MLKDLRPALVILVALTAITGLAYPLAMTGIAQLAFPAAANGSRVMRGETVIGSTLIGQDFTAPDYFHGRPSATTGPDPADPAKSLAQPYNASNSMGSNFGPTQAALVARLKGATETLRAEHPGAAVPVDLVTTSGSGLDPDLSPQAALFQVPRVATARGLPQERVAALVAAGTQPPLFGILGEPRVNVLALNLALDRLAAQK